MPDDRELQDLDPYDVMDHEAERLNGWFSLLGPDGWAETSACAGWDVKDILAHLGFGEEYNAACLDDDLPAFFERYTSRGATDMNSFNALGVTDRADRTVGELLDEWRAGCGRSRAELRRLDGQQMTTGAGPYPVRWQAWHLASELATHADDIAVPETGEEPTSRLHWRVRFARFALDEMKPEVTVESVDGGTLVRSGDVEAVLDDTELTAAVNGRLPSDHPIDPALRASLSALG